MIFKELAYLDIYKVDVVASIVVVVVADYIIGTTVA